jgi:aspartyl-tRNA(Asn)/glutamyl-tRNA(Gln) amidotransferase subunit A
LNEYVSKLKSAGHTVEEVSLPMAEYALAVYYILVPAEISSNLARYDGIRYGHRAKDIKTLTDLIR